MTASAQEAKAQDTSTSQDSSVRSVTLYTSWHCPYAGRVGIALDLKQIPHTKIEVDPYNKSKEWLSKNPLGKVPTIEHDDHFIYESSMILEYLDISYPQHLPLLFSKTNAYQHWNNKIWIDFINNNIGEQYYYLNSKQNISSYFEHITQFIGAMDASGPFFNGKVCMAVDIAFIPWAMRMDNINGKIETYFTNKTLQRYTIWWNACTSLNAVANNQPNKLKMAAQHAKTP
eukprot:702520_1